MKGTLCLHSGSALRTLAEVRGTNTPQPTATYFPIDHGALYDRSMETLDAFGFNVVAERHALSPDGQTYFGLLDLGNPHLDYGVCVGLRNDHTKRFPAGVAVGSHVFVCDNLAFSSQIVVNRKHTRFIMRDLDQLIMAAFGKLGEEIGRQEEQIEAYKSAQLTYDRARSLMVECVKKGIIGCTNLPAVVNAWETDERPEFAGPSLWRLFNSVTEVGKQWAAPLLVTRTRLLHGLCNMEVGIAV